MRDRLLNELRTARKAAALSQAALAAKSAVGRVTIARLEAGALQDFRVGTLARLCEALGLELAAVPRGALAHRRSSPRPRAAARAAPRPAASPRRARRAPGRHAGG